MFVSLAGRTTGRCLSFLSTKNLNMGQHAQNLQADSFIASIIMGTPQLLPFYITCSNLDLSWVVRKSVESKTCWHHHLSHFLTDHDGVWSCQDATHILNILFLLSEVYWVNGRNCCFAHCVGKKISMHSFFFFFFFPIWLKFDVMIGATVLYIFIEVVVTFILLEGQRVQEDFCTNYLTKFWMDLDAVCCWYMVWWTSYLSVQHSREKTQP